MARTNPYDIRHQDYDYYDTRAQNADTSWLIAFILIVAAVAAVMFFSRADYGVTSIPMTAPGTSTSSTLNPPITQPTPPAAIPNQNTPAPAR
ncbi:MAG TPA: hypothetical protein VGQ97_04090 [Xanthobacteraceae bacterium]|nr:hypothetical protein [Xanthobacteraceae bacterium]